MDCKKENKIKFIKVEINNTLIVKVINGFYFPKHTLSFNLQNATLNLIEKITYFYDGNNSRRVLVLSNTFKYNSDFDFNLNKIKDKPNKNKYYVINILKNINAAYSLLKDFLNYSPEKKVLLFLI